MNSLVAHLRRLLSGAVLAFTLLPGAQAGLVTGTYDPQFGGNLTNLSWQVRTQWLVPDSCPNAADGTYSTTDPGGPCESTLGDPVRLLAFWVRWFDTSGPNAGDPNDFFQHVFPNSAHYGLCVTGYTDPGCSEANVFTYALGAEPFAASNVRVEQGQVVGFDTSLAGVDIDTFGWPDAAGIHTFNLRFTTNGPVFTCRNSGLTPITDHSCDTLQTADNTELNQFLVTYNTDDNSDPKRGFDSEGRPLGIRLDGQGNVIPEPSALLLALVALGAVGASRRRRTA